MVKVAGINRYDTIDVSKSYIIQKSGPKLLQQQSMKLSWVRRDGSVQGLVCRTPKYFRSNFPFLFLLFFLFLVLIL